MQAAAGIGSFSGEDAYGNKNSGTTTQDYQVINGQVKLAKNISIADYENIDGSISHNESTVSYSYSETNLLTGAEGHSVTAGSDVFGNGYSSVTTDTYDIMASQAKRVRSVTENNSEDLFGSLNYSETVNEYRYDEETGALLSATGYTDTTGEDLFGNQSVTHTVHTYQIINGQARLMRSETRGDLINPASDLGYLISGIQNFLEGYVAAVTPEEKQQRLEEAGLKGLNLGLTDLTSSGLVRIVGWLWRASTRVINCAINSIYNILSEVGLSVTKENLAKKAVLIDVLTGVITPENATGDLKLSMYSMIKMAESEGLTLKGANVTIDQLRSIAQPVIAHVGGNHYIVIKSVNDSAVTYIDNGVEETITIAKFLSVWEGNILTPVVPKGAAVLDLEGIKGIRGADETPPYDNPDDKPTTPPTNPETGNSDKPSGWSANPPANPPAGSPSGTKWSDVSHWAWE